MKPLVIDLCCGLGGWTTGFLAEGYDAVGFDIERHVYGEKRYPGQLVIQDMRTLHGSQFHKAAAIVASPPCQRYSRMAMPFSKFKDEARAIRADTTGAMLRDLNELFETCFRLAREASEAAGRKIPLVIENVKGAQPWVGRARAHFGSYYLWGDIESVGGRIVGQVPKFGESLRAARRNKREGRNFHAFENGLGSSPSFNGAEHETRGLKPESLTEDFNGHDDPRRGRETRNGSWFGVGSDGKSNLRESDALKVPGISFSGYGEPGYKAKGFNVTAAQRWREEQQNGVKCTGRKAASAMIAEIPFELASYIARILKP